MSLNHFAVYLNHCKSIILKKKKISQKGAPAGIFYWLLSWEMKEDLGVIKTQKIGGSSFRCWDPRL